MWKFADAFQVGLRTPRNGMKKKKKPFVLYMHFGSFWFFKRVSEAAYEPKLFENSFTKSIEVLSVVN